MSYMGGKLSENLMLRGSNPKSSFWFDRNRGST